MPTIAKPRDTFIMSCWLERRHVCKVRTNQNERISGKDFRFSRKLFNLKMFWMSFPAQKSCLKSLNLLVLLVSINLISGMYCTDTSIFVRYTDTCDISSIMTSTSCSCQSSQAERDQMNLWNPTLYNITFSQRVKIMRCLRAFSRPFRYTLYLPLHVGYM